MMQDLLGELKKETSQRGKRRVRGFRKDKDGNFFLHVEVPGLKAENLELEFQNGGVKVRGKTPEAPDAYQNEIRYFFTLPEEADATRIQATLRDGVLTLRVPAKADADSRKITIDE
ncbi:MAG: Hsp20/alpha crystallin family protein [Oligosphaeraceae bacterium]